MKRNNHTQFPPVIIKDDSSLHALLERLQREREKIGIQIDQESANSEATMVNRHQKRERIKIKPSKSRKPIVREYALLITPAPDGGYLAYCPAVYGYYSRGKTPAQARKQLADNLHHHLAYLAAQGKPLPRTNGRIEKLKISVSV